MTYHSKQNLSFFALSLFLLLCSCNLDSNGKKNDYELGELLIDKNGVLELTIKPTDPSYELIKDILFVKDTIDWNFTLIELQKINGPNKKVKKLVDLIKNISAIDGSENGNNRGGIYIICCYLGSSWWTTLSYCAVEIPLSCDNCDCGVVSPIIIF